MKREARFYIIGEELVIVVDGNPDLDKAFDFTKESARMDVLVYLAQNDLVISRSTAETFRWAAMYQ